MAERDPNPYKPAAWNGALEASTRVTKGTSGPSGPRGEPRQTTLRAYDRLGNYQLLRRLGGGGMAEVFLARSLLAAGVEKLVAFKTALPEYGPDTQLGGMFLNEAKISTAFQHPNVIQVFDFGEASGRPYLAMEFIRGRDLAQVLARAVQDGKPVPVPVVVAIAIDVCKALEYVHNLRAPDGRPLNLVHRDVSPGNILVSTLGTAKLMDFGVAAAGGLATTERVVGKRIYSAPEQREGGREATPQWDIFALGVTLRELLTLDHGPMPRPRASLLNRDVPPDLDSVIGAATHPDPNFRCPSASALRKLLERVQDRFAASGDVAGFINGLFGPDFMLEEHEDSALVVRGRERTTSRFAGLAAGPLNAIRRRILSSRLYMDNRWLLAVVLAVLLFGGGAAVVAGVNRARFAQQVQTELLAVDTAIAQGQWVGSEPDSALSHLKALEALSPSDPRAAARRDRLSQKLIALGEKALARKDEAEALVHFESAVVVDPGAAAAKARIAELQDKARALARQKKGAAP